MNDDDLQGLAAYAATSVRVAIALANTSWGPPDAELSLDEWTDRLEGAGGRVLKLLRYRTRSWRVVSDAFDDMFRWPANDKAEAALDLKIYKALMTDPTLADHLQDIRGEYAGRSVGTQLAAGGRPDGPVLSREPGLGTGRSRYARKTKVIGKAPRSAIVFQQRHEIKKRLADSNPGDTLILVGGGGTGKTQIAAEYFNDERDRGIPLAIWVNASSRNSILERYAEASLEILGPHASVGDADTKNRAESFLNWLEVSDQDWLIVLDDVARSQDLGQLDGEPALWPVGRMGTTIVTSRLRERIFLENGRELRIGAFSENEAHNYLRRKLADREGVEWNDREASKLSRRLQHHPLALALACGVIISRRTSCGKYLETFERGRLADKFPIQGADDYHRTVGKTWLHAIDQAAQQTRYAYPALLLASVVDGTAAPEEIWTCEWGRRFLAEMADDFGRQSEEEALPSVDAVTTALSVLSDFSLIDYQPGPQGQTVHTHTLVQVAMLDTVDPETVTAAVRTVVQALVDLWAGFEEKPVLRANEQALLRRGSALQGERSYRHLMFLAGRSFGDAGNVKKAIEHFHLLTEMLSPTDPRHAEASYELAYWRGESGDPIGAVKAFKRLEEQQTEVLGRNHPVTLRMRHRHAVWKGHAGDPSAARNLLESISATEIMDSTVDPREKLEAKSDYAFWSGMAGEPHRAAGLFRDLLEECTHELGSLDELTLNVRGNLAQWEGSAGHVQEAIALYQDLVSDLTGDRRFGRGHPRTLQARHGLVWWRAWWAAESNQPDGLAEAVGGFEQLLSDKQNYLGYSHRDYLLVRRDHAWWLGRAGKVGAALTRLQEVLGDMEGSFPADNPEILTTKKYIALLSAEAGDFAGAAQALRSVIDEAAATLAADHPELSVLQGELRRVEHVHEFKVWAPLAASVDLVLAPSDDRMTCHATGDGWWSVSVQGMGHGTDYWYSLNGGAPLPDPRSAWQPYGVHGPSRLFDTSRFTWSSGSWVGREAPDGQVRTVLGGVFYELHVGTFTPEGTFAAAIARLDHLVDLGVDIVEVMPVAEFDGQWGWGYDGVALYSVHGAYGGPEGLQQFVDACHLRGLAVCLDVVFNHLGPSGNYLPLFGPYFTERTKQHQTLWGAAVNLDDQGAEHVRRWICDAMLRWFSDFRLDALRLDAVHALVDESDRHVLAQLSDEVAELSARLRRPLALIAESDLNDPIVIEPTAEGGRGMAGQWSDDLHHAVHALLTGETYGYYCDFGTVDVLERTLANVFFHNGTISNFRWGKKWGKPVDPERHRGRQFVVALQNHDQVGNRAIGDRISHKLTPARLAAGIGIILTAPFSVLIFMGEEWAASTPWQYFTNFQPELGRAVRDGRWREFARHGWRVSEIPDPQDPATRTSSILKWDEVGEGIHERILQWYRDLISVRRCEPDLSNDDLSTLSVHKGPGSSRVGWGSLTIHRGSIDILVNLTGRRLSFPCPPESSVLLSWDKPDVADGAVTLPGDGIVVLRHR